MSMNELRIAARVRDADLLAGVKSAAATYRARLIQWTDALSADPNLQDADLVVLEAANSNSAVEEFNIAKSTCPRAEIIIFAPPAATPDDVRRLFRAGAHDVLGLPIAQDQLMSVCDAIGPAPWAILTVCARCGVRGRRWRNNARREPGRHFANRHAASAAIDRSPSRRIDRFRCTVRRAALAMDISPRKDLTEILRAPKRLDAHFLDGVLERHRSGVRLLAAPSTAIPLDAVDSAVASSIINVAASTHDIVIVEMPMAMTDWTGALLRRADHLLLVSSVAVRSVAGARRILDAAADLNVDSSRWSLAFNRLNSVLDGNDRRLLRRSARP
jgi:pilus assembly protein CpaE